jgi:hypothetical protein
VFVAIEFCIVGLTSVLSDGLLLYQSKDSSNRVGLLYLDRKTASFHAIFLLGLFLYRGVGGYASPLQLCIALVLGAASLATFHARLYYTYVEQRWRPARRYARLWHIGAVATSLLGLVQRFPLLPATVKPS